MRDRSTDYLLYGRCTCVNSLKSHKNPKGRQCCFPLKKRKPTGSLQTPSTAVFTDYGEPCDGRGRAGDYSREGRLEGLEEAIT